MTTLTLKHAGRRAQLDVPDNVTDLSVPWPTAHEPDEVLDVRVKRNLDGRALGLKVVGTDKRPQRVQGEGGTAYRDRDGRWWNSGEQKAVR